MAGYPTSTIASGGATGTSIKLNRERIVGFFMPAGWTTATLGFDVTRDGGSNWFPVCDMISDYTGAEVACTVAVGQFYALNPALLVGGLEIRPRSGSSGSPTTQAAQRILTFVTAGLE
jgi:hypothetical protein